MYCLQLLVSQTNGLVGVSCDKDSDCGSSGEFCDYNFCGCRKCYSQIGWTCVRQECISDGDCGKKGICLGNWNSCECACMSGYKRKKHRCVKIPVGLTKWDITGIAIASLLLAACVVKVIWRSLQLPLSATRMMDNEVDLREHIRPYTITPNERTVSRIESENQPGPSRIRDDDIVASVTGDDAGAANETGSCTSTRGSNLLGVGNGPPIYRSLFPAGRVPIQSSTEEDLLPTYDDFSKS